MDETVEGSEPRGGAAVSPGGHIGKYELLRVLGSGGMGMVWAARDPDLDREIAIKLLRGAHASPEQRTRLLREARAMARLKHPNVLTVYEVGTDGDRDFIAMEIVDGTSLDIWLHERPPAREIWDALLAAGRGLAAAHDAGLVHRDFKPHNVLRSRDGRVLVTDFGLARGHNEIDVLGATLDPATDAGDSVLDVRVTTTGQMLGTPAYMAPEQFAGETPDPRTDQFAFCVTLWEALAGERPFRGTTIDSLRAESERGITTKAPGTAKLPGAVRDVLIRGLAPERDRRWRDVPQLLRALARARRAPLRRLAIALPVLAVVAAGAIAMTRHHAPVAAATGCMPGGQALAGAWSGAARSELLARHADAKAAADALDAYGARWLAGYKAACERPLPQRAAAVECYLSARDELAVQVEILQRFGTSGLGVFGPWGALAARDTCTSAPRVFSPRLPDDARRSRAIALLARAYGTLPSSPSNVVGEQNQLRSEAKAIGWPSLAARVDEAVAIAAELTYEDDVAHRSYRQAAELAHDAGDAPLEARARLGVLETGRTSVADDMPEHAYDDALRDAELAVKRAGDDPAQIAALDVSRAAHAAYADYDLDKAIELAQKAYTTLRDARDMQRLQVVAADLSEYLATRAGTGDLARADAVLRETLATLHRANLAAPVLTFPLQRAAVWIAWLRGDLDRVHELKDASGYSPVAVGPARTGRVIDEAGHPVAGARVVAWNGDLFGDASRLCTTEYGMLDVTTTDEHGSFKLRAVDGGAIMAETADKRSLPVLARSGTQLVVRATRSLTGTVDVGGDPAVGIEPFVRIDVTPTTSWVLATAPGPDNRYTLAGIPAGAITHLGATSTHWPRHMERGIEAGIATDHATIHWPIGGLIDYTVKARRGVAWLLRGKHTLKTRADVERIARTAPDAAMARIAPVGWGATSTPVGTKTYQPAEHHIVFRDVAPGEITLCVSPDPGPDVRCITANHDEEHAMRRGGRHWYGGEAADFDAQP